MSVKQPHLAIGNISDAGETKTTTYAMGPEGQAHQLGEAIRPRSLNSDTQAKSRILIVTDDDSIYKELEVILLHEEFASEREKSMTAGCDSARSGRFQVIVTAPILTDGSWKQLVDIEGHSSPGFVIILLVSTLSLNQWAQAVEDGAFDVLDARNELPRVALAARCALWAAYLKGAGPHPEHGVH